MRRVVLIPINKGKGTYTVDDNYFVVSDFKQTTSGFETPDATPTTKGKAKLYDDLGLNEDGSVMQKVITEALYLKASIKDVDPFNIFVNQGLQYFLPKVSTATFTDTLRVGSITMNGNTANTTDREPQVIISTTSTAGNAPRMRGQTFVIPHISDWYYRVVKMISPNSNIADSRFAIGLTNSYVVSDPGNVQPDTILNCILVGKMASSNNLHIIHNDATGLATTIDLGVNYPFTNTTKYYYCIEWLKLRGTTDVVVKVTRIDETGATISVSHTLTTDLPIGITNLSPFAYISNNATADIASFVHYGCVANNQRGIF